jgi:hypothetical protein
MEENNSKPDLKGFITKIILIEIGIVLVSLFISLFMGFSFLGIPMFILGMILTSRGSVNRKRKIMSEEINFYDPLEPHHDVLGTRPVSTYERYLNWRFRNTEPVHKFGRERIFMFSGLFALIISLPLICKLMYF